MCGWIGVPTTHQLCGFCGQMHALAIWYGSECEDEEDREWPANFEKAGRPWAWLPDDVRPDGGLLDADPQARPPGRVPEATGRRATLFIGLKSMDDAWGPPINEHEDHLRHFLRAGGDMSSSSSVEKGVSGRDGTLHALELERVRPPCSPRA